MRGDHTQGGEARAKLLAVVVAEGDGLQGVGVKAGGQLLDRQWFAVGARPREPGLRGGTVNTVSGSNTSVFEPTDST
jgi:hypothetical protein